MTATQDDLLTRLTAVAREARDAGYAITFWSPEEVGWGDASQLIDIVVERASDYLEYANKEE